ncbi:MAG: conserved membrane protein of unknown function [Promethearchaeota archaeon]|nr:MAG: conserved membrane protein of unknown function [Candidatus Lokiarchaeota archaeon]
MNREPLLPEKAGNDFKGYKFTEYVFLIIALISTIRSLIHLFAPDGGARSIATIDLNIEGGDIIISVFALWGSSQLLMAFVFLIVYFRYKNLIPLMYLIIIIEYSLRIIIGFLKPIETTGIAPGAIGNLIILPLALIMLYFSISSRDAPKEG